LNVKKIFAAHLKWKGSQAKKKDSDSANLWSKRLKCKGGESSDSTKEVKIPHTSKKQKGRILRKGRRGTGLSIPFGGCDADWRVSERYPS